MDIFETKKYISRSFIGKDGIHGIGINPAENAICIYTSNEKAAILNQIRDEASPYGVIVIGPEDGSTITSW